MSRQIMSDTSLTILSENFSLANLLSSTLFIDWIIRWTDSECICQLKTIFPPIYSNAPLTFFLKAIIIVSALGSHMIMLSFKNYTMIGLSLWNHYCNCYKIEHGKSYSCCSFSRNFQYTFHSLLCFLVIEVRWGRVLDLPTYDIKIQYPVVIYRKIQQIC